MTDGLKINSATKSFKRTHCAQHLRATVPSKHLKNKSALAFEEMQLH